MNELDSITIKPGRNYRITFAVYSAVFFALCVDIIGGIVSAIKRDIYDFAMLQFVVLGFAFVCLIGYFISELVCRQKVIISSKELVKYKGNKIVFKISRNDIVNLIYNKPTLSMRLLFLLGVFVRMPFVGMLSIRYKNAEIDEPRVRNSFEELVTLSEAEKESGIKEYLELLGEKELKRVSAVLNINVEYISD
ncbi:MAG: hypothetical protein J1G38_05725 [Clostridiales bacterium]|nr:hypothetical protein [Clostridiales bacterium]